MKVSSKLTRKLFVWFLIVCVISSIIYYYQKLRLNNELFDSGHIANAYVTEVWDAFKGNIGFKYYFTYNGNRYQGKDFFNNVNFSIRDSILYKPVPVLFLPNHPNKNKLLLNRANFERYGREYPDSLSWLKKYLKEP